MTNKKKLIGNFLWELVIVFIGVYAAFAFSRYQESNRDKKIKIDYLKSFRSELKFVRSHVVNIKERSDNLFNQFNVDLEAGKRPTPKPLNTYLSNQLLITQAGLKEDVFLQLSPGLASSLSGGYDNLKKASKWIESFNDICNRNLISNEPIKFYDRQGKLKPEFDWYLNGLQTISNYLENILNDINNGAVPATEQLIKELE